MKMSHRAIHRAREQHRQDIAAEIRASFDPKVP